MSQYDHNWQCRNAINCGCCHISDQSEEDGELCQDCHEELQERENRFAGLVAENAKLKEELAEAEKLRVKAKALGQMLQTCLSLPVRGQPCLLSIDKSDPDATEYKNVYWMDAVMDCLEANTGMVYDREMAYLSALPPSQYHKAVKKLEKERAAQEQQ